MDGLGRMQSALNSFMDEYAASVHQVVRLNLDVERLHKLVKEQEEEINVLKRKNTELKERLLESTSHCQSQSSDQPTVATNTTSSAANRICDPIMDRKFEINSDITGSEEEDVPEILGNEAGMVKDTFEIGVSPLRPTTEEGVDSDIEILSPCPSTSTPQIVSPVFQTDQRFSLIKRRLPFEIQSTPTKLRVPKKSPNSVKSATRSSKTSRIIRHEMTQSHSSIENHIVDIYSKPKYRIASLSPVQGRLFSETMISPSKRHLPNLSEKISSYSTIPDEDTLSLKTSECGTYSGTKVVLDQIIWKDVSPKKLDLTQDLQIKSNKKFPLFNKKQSKITSFMTGRRNQDGSLKDATTVVSTAAKKSVFHPVASNTQTTSSNHPTISVSLRPKQSTGNEPTYKYKESVRNKDDRKALHAEDCPCCRAFYKITENVPSLFELGVSNPKSRLQQSSRHRVTAPTPDTPPGFWDVGMPDSQEIEDERRAKRQKREELEGKKRRRMG